MQVLLIAKGAPVLTTRSSMGYDTATHLSFTESAFAMSAMKIL